MNSNKRNRIDFSEPFIDFTNKIKKIDPIKNITTKPIDNESLEPTVYYAITPTKKKNETNFL